MSHGSAFVPAWHDESHVTPSGGSHSSSPTTFSSPQIGSHSASLHVHPAATLHSTQPTLLTSHSSAASFLKFPQTAFTGKITSSAQPAVRSRKTAPFKDRSRTLPAIACCSGTVLRSVLRRCSRAGLPAADRARPERR